jgi:hypothetical protein
LGSHETQGAVGLSNEDSIERECVKVHVQVEGAAKALDDGDRPGAAVAVARGLGSLPLETVQCTRVDRKHRAAERMILGELIAKLEGKAQDPLSNRYAWEHVVDEMGRTLGHAAASAAWAKAATLAGKRNQAISAAARTPKAGKAMREHAAANESLKLTLHEQGGSALTSIELPEEGPQVLADDAVEHPMLRRATHVRSGNRVGRSRGVKLHDHGTPSKRVPLFAFAFSTRFR